MKGEVNEASARTVERRGKITSGDIGATATLVGKITLLALD